MKTRGILWLVAVAMLSIGAQVDPVHGASKSTPSASDMSQAIQPETAREQQEKQKKLEQQNLQEQQRLQDSTLKEKGESPSYSGTPKIGGQAGASEFPLPAFPQLKGELVKIEGEVYTIRDAEGKEIQVQTDKNTEMGRPSFHVGDMVEVKRTLKGYAMSVNPTSAPEKSAGSPDLGSPQASKQTVSGEVLRIEEGKYWVKDRDGHEVALIVNQNTRMSCPQTGSMSGMLPDPNASDKPENKGQPQDLARTAEQPGSEVGPGTKPSADSSVCKFKVGDKIEADISDMGAATFIKTAGRPQPGQPLP